MEAPKRVYDALDAGNYKQALKLCEKNERNPVLVSLKALTLQRLGRRDEADRTCSMILARGVVNDDNVLTPLGMTLVALRRHGDALAMWEGAVAERPDDEGCGREVVRAALRMGAFGKMRAAAAALYKGTRKAEYLLWCGACGLLEKRHGGDEAGGALALKLAERMVVKAVKERRGGELRLASAEELELLTLLRREAGDADGALAAVRAAADGAAPPRVGGPGVVRGPQAGDLRRLEARWLLDKGESEAAVAKFRALATAAPDDWDALDGLVRSSHASDGGAAARRFLQEAEAARPGARGPALALLLLESLEAEKTTDGATLSAKVRAYEDRWATSPSCFEDLEPHLSILSKLPSPVTVADIRLDCEGDDAASRATRAKVARFRGRECGGVEAAKAHLAAARATDDAATARDLVVLAAYALGDLGTAAARVDACRVLQKAHAAEPSAATVAVAYMDALAHIGAGEAALRAYGTLGVKQIQLDSLGYLIMPCVAHFGFFEELKTHCRNVLHLHETARRDAGREQGATSANFKPLLSRSFSAHFG